MTLRKILMGLAAVVGFTTAATAATPVAVWDGDFSTTFEGYTLDLNGNNEEGGVITIGDMGVKVVFDAEMDNGVTVIYKYAGMTFDKEQALATVSSGTTGSKFGVELTSGNFPKGIYKDAAWGNAESKTFSTASGTLSLTYKQGSGTRAYYVADGAASQIYGNGGLHESGAKANGVNVGGEHGETIAASTGTQISAIAVFNRVLTTDEIAAYKFPSEKPTYESVVSMNFGADSYNVPADTDPGAIIDDSNWYNLNGNNITDAEAGSLLVSYGGSGNYQKTDRIPVYLKGYLDDNGKTVNITVKNLKTASYDVYIYCNSDNASGWAYKTVNGTAYTADATGKGVAGTSTWGNNSNLSEVLGKNVMVVENVYPDAESKITIASVRNSGYRGCIAAIQVCQNPAAPTYEAEIDEETDWKDIEWDPSKPEGGFEDDAVLKLKVNGKTTLTFSEILNIPQRLEINDDGENALTLKAADALFTDGCYEKTIATFGSFVPGCAKVSEELPAGFSGAYTLTDSGFKVRAQNREVISINIGGGKLNSNTGPIDSPEANLVPADQNYYGVAPTMGETWNNIGKQWKNTRSTVTLEGSKAAQADGTVVERPTIDLSATATTTWQADITNPFLRGYLDDGDGLEVAVHGVPYTKYDVIVYATSDATSAVLSPITVNGEQYTFVDGETVKGSTTWGKALCNVPAIGDNALYIKDCTGEQLTISAAKTTGGRGTLCAVQVINQGEILIRSEYYGEMDGDVVWTDGKTAGNLTQLGDDWVNGQLSTITITNTVEGANFSFGAETIGQQIKFVSEYPITIDAASMVEYGKLGIYDFTEVEGGAIFQLPEGEAFDAANLPSTIKGDWKFSKDGILVYDGKYPTAAEQTFFKSADDWAGTVWIKNVKVAGEVFNNYGNANSTLRFTGVKGWFNYNTNETTLPIELVDEDETLALEVTDGSLNKAYIFDKITGDGTINVSSVHTDPFIVQIKDVSEHTGKITSLASTTPNGDETKPFPILIGATTGALPYGSTSKITVADGAAINLDCGWEAESVAFGATLTLMSGAEGGMIISGLTMEEPVYLATKVFMYGDEGSSHFSCLGYEDGGIWIRKAMAFSIKDCENTTFTVEGAFYQETGFYTAYYYAAKGAPVKVTYTTDEGYFFSDGTTTKVVEATVEEDMWPIEVEDEAKPYVAKLGDECFESLNDAFENAAYGDTIFLLQNASIDRGIDLVYDEGYYWDCTLDMNGKTISPNYTPSKAEYKPMFNVSSNATLTITGNGTIAGWTGAAAAALDGKSVIAVNGGSLYYLNGTLTAGGEGSDGMYGVYVCDSGKAHFGADKVEGGPSITTWFAAIGANNLNPGELGVDIIVYGGEYTQLADGTGKWWDYFCGAIYAPAKGSYTIKGGTFNGTVGSIALPYNNVAQIVRIEGGTFAKTLYVGEKTASEGLGERLIWKDDGVTLAAPTGYEWDEDGYLVQAAVTFTIADVANTTKEVEGAELVEGNTYKAAPGEAITVTYTANEGYVFVNNKKTSVVETAAAKDITITTTTECVAAVAKIGDTYYATLSAAAAAVEEGGTVTLLKDVTAMGAVGAKATLDLNGKTLTVADGSDYSINGTIAIVNGVAGQGGLAIDGTVEVDGALDISKLAYGAGGLLSGHDGTLSILDGGKATLLDAWAAQGLTPNWLAANRSGFLEAEDGGMVKMGSTTYTYQDGFFASEDAVAKATITTAGGAGQITYTETFDTLAAALAAANAGTTVTLLADVTTDAKAPFTIAKNITLDFATFTVEKTVANDYTFDIPNGATVVFKGTMGGAKQAVSNLNPTSPASMIRNKGTLTIDGGVYTSDFCIIKNDEDPGAGTLTVNGGTFNVVQTEGGYTGFQTALMNWAAATINGGTWNGAINTRSCDANAVSKAGTTEIAATLEGSVKYVLSVGYEGDTTCANVPQMKGIALANVELRKVATITDDLVLTEKDGYVTVAKAEAKIGDVYYISLNDAAAAAKDGDTVTLLKDVTTTAYVVFDKNSNVTLDLNGKTISSATDECIVVGKQGDSPLGTGTLTITGEGKVVQTYAGSDADVVWARWGNIVIENSYFEVNGTYQCVYSTSGSKVTINGGTFKNLTGGDVLNVNNTGKTTDIQCFGGSFSKDPELGDDALGGSFVAEGNGSVEAEGLWQVVALPVATATKLTEGVPEDVDAAYQFSTDESAEGSPFATWEANFDVSFSKDIAAGSVELAGQYGEYPWTKMALEDDLAAGEKWTLLPAGTVNFTELCAMKDFFCAVKNFKQVNVGADITVELTLSNGTKTYVITTVDETFTKELAPQAKIEELAEKPENLDVAYNCIPTTDEDAFYNGWEANITVSFDKAVTAGSLVLSGQYNTYDWTPYPITEDLAANEEITLLPAGLVHYQDLYKMLGGFNCGVKNLDDANVGTAMTVKIVITNGEKTIVMGEQGYTLAFNLPETTATKITEGVPEGVDAAYKFSTTESGEGSFFAKWEANFDVSFDKDVKAGSVELAGQYGAYDWTTMALTKDLAAGEKWTLLPAGTVNYEELCAMKDFFCAVKNLANENIGTGIKVELTFSNGEKTYVLNTVDETLTQLGSPTAEITEVTPAGKNLDAQFNCLPTSEQEARFDKWGANFTVTFDKPVKAGTVVLSGQYNEYPWTPMVLDRDLAAGEAWTLLEEGLVAVEDLYKMVGGFNCGIKNVSQANVGTTVTVKIVVNNGEKTFESATKDYTLAFTAPTATVTKMEPVPETLDDAYTFAVAADEVGEGTKSPFQDWTADFTVSFDKPVAAGTVTLAGAYEAWQQGAWVSYDLPALAAGEEYAVLKGFGLDTKLTYRELCDIVKSFDCGVLNNLKANEGTVMTVKLVMAKGDETYMVTNVTSTLVKKSEEIDLGGGIKAKDFDNGDIEISGDGSGELDATKIAQLARPITNLVVGTGVTKIAADAFKNNRDLRSVTIGENCVEIGESAFGKVRNITNVVVKGSVSVADYAFLRCNSLEKLTFESMPEFGKTPFAIHSAIYMKDGMPEIYTIPEVVIAGYRQALMGTNELEGEETEWTEITDEAEKANYHFFKVEMKQIED